MVDALAGGSQRFLDHFKQVRVTEFSNDKVLINERDFRGQFHRISANMGFFPTREEAVKWYREWLVNSLASDQTNLTILENRISLNTVFLNLLKG